MSFLGAAAGSTMSRQRTVTDPGLIFEPNVANAVAEYHETTDIDETFDLTLPTNNAGDLICIFQFVDGFTEARSPAFNTCTRRGTLNSSAGADTGLDLWTRTSTGGEVTITGTSETSATNRGVAIMFTFPTGTWNEASIMDTAVLNNTHNNIDANTVVGDPPPITTVTDGACVITTWQLSGEDATATSAPTGYTFIIDALESGLSAGTPQAAAAFKIIASAGVEDPDTWDNTGPATAQESASCVFAFRPAA